MSTPQLLLERYVEAKDLVRPRLMRQIYAPDAVLTFSITTDSIAFPERVAGIDQITKTLIVDFAAKYSRCKTFYVCESQPGQVNATTSTGRGQSAAFSFFSPSKSYIGAPGHFV